jgi:alpha-glucan, water dikinase
MEAVDPDLPPPLAPLPEPPPPPTAGAEAAHGDQGEGQLPPPPPQEVATVLRKIEKWWLYRSYGDVLAGSRVIPMKTPLTLELQARQARLASGLKDRSGSVDGSGGAAAPGQEQGEQQEHTIGRFVRQQAAQGRAVGLIVDLSNHECLYAEDLVRECPGLAYQHFHFGA